MSKGASECGIPIIKASSIEGYVPMIKACSVEVLCQGFDWEQLAELYKRFTGYVVPRAVGKRRLASGLKRYVETGDNSELDLSGKTVDELKLLDKNTLICAWEMLYGIPCNKRSVTDIAWGIWDMHASMKRTADLVKNLR